MKGKKELQSKKWKKIVCLLGVIIILALFLEGGILKAVNRKNANQTSQVLLDQAINIIEKNQEDEENLIQSLKEDYMVRAKAVSYIIDHNEAAEYDQAELKKIAKLMSIDEIHLFDHTGKVYSGTVPKYYGYNFSSGEQIAYFKPMLKDKKLTMCQDVTPNTSEGKKMMYAITWSDSADRMVQVGIEPVRLLEDVKQNEVSSVVSNMPVYDGISIYVADKDNGKIYAATDQSKIGKTLDDIGLPKKEIQNQEKIQDTITIDHRICNCIFEKAGNYVVGVTFATSSNHESNVIAMLMVAVYLGLAGVCILLIVARLFKATQEKKEQFAILSSMSEIYHSMYLINLEKNSAMAYSEADRKTNGGRYYQDAREMLSLMMQDIAIEAYWESVNRFIDLRTIAERMDGKKIISGEFVGKETKWFRASFIMIEKNQHGLPVKLIFTIQSIDDEKRKEEKLVYTSNTDQLTGCFNRRAYEKDFAELSLEKEFIYISLDVNGLKIVNDSLGHSAGDELLQGAARCMRESFDDYGKVYRIGGDEFIAILFTDNERFNEIREAFELSVNQWYGKQVQSLTVSLGFVSSREKTWKSMTEIANAADVRMYERKAMYYRQNGVERRGQPAAYLALFRIYSNILKVNLLQDSYRILNWEKEPDASGPGQRRLSEWLHNEENTRQIHPDDLPGYLEKTEIEALRSVLGATKKSITISYRKMSGGRYCQTTMEIISAEEPGIAFLYVKMDD